MGDPCRPNELKRTAKLIVLDQECVALRPSTGRSGEIERYPVGELHRDERAHKRSQDVREKLRRSGRISRPNDGVVEFDGHRCCIPSDVADVIAGGSVLGTVSPMRERGSTAPARICSDAAVHSSEGITTT
jgi:hypothetical protein